MIKVKEILALLLCCIACNSWGQNFGAASPEGVNMPGSIKSTSKDELVNVDLFTGIGTATIPIYERTIDGLNVGVSLSSSLKGVQVDQVASSVGLGWDINAGGSITREVLGIEDDKVIPAGWGAFHYAFGTNGYSSEESDVFTATFGGRTIKFYILRRQKKKTFKPLGCTDCQYCPADCHDYNDPSTQNLIFTEPRSEIKIDFVNRFVDQNIGIVHLDTNFTFAGEQNTDEANEFSLTFYLTDEKGNIFIFEKGDYERKPIEVGSATKYFPITKWNLTKIITYTGQVIKYNYTTTDALVSQKVVRAVFEQDSVFTVNSNTQYASAIDIAWDKCFGISFDGRMSHISSIEYPDGIKVSFQTDTANDQRCDAEGTFLLKKINIVGAYNNDVSNTISYKFNYSYFNTPNQGYNQTEIAHGSPCDDIKTTTGATYLTKTTRLKLNGIDRIGSDNSTTERYYTFEYNNVPLPERFAFAQDHFGYYNNGQTISGSGLYIQADGAYNSPVPLHTFTYHYFNGNGWDTDEAYYGTEKGYNFQYAPASLLTKIINANGGNVTIEYGPPVAITPTNPYGLTIDSELDKVESGRECQDGVIVKKLTYKDGYNVDNTITTEYNYSDGQYFLYGGYYWYPNTLRTDNSNNPVSTISRFYTNYYVSNRNFYRGSNHGFSTVYVTTKGYNSEQISKAKYSFSNLVYTENGTTKSCLKYPTGLLNHTLPPHSFLKARMGLPLEVTTYDQNANVLSTTISQYQENNDPFYPPNTVTNLSGDGNSRKFYWSYLDPNNATGGEYELQGYFPIRADQWNLTSNTVKDFSDGQERTITNNFVYDRNDNLIRAQWTNSKNEEFRKYTKYNYEYYLTGYHWHNGVWSRQFGLVDAMWKMNGGSDSTLLTISVKTPENIDTPKRFPVTFTSNLSQPMTASQFAAQSLINVDNALLSSNSSPNLKKIITNTRYHPDFDFLIEGKFGEEEVYSSSIYDKVFKVPVAEASNAKYDEIAFTSFEGGENNYDVRGSNPVDFNKGNLDFEKSSIILENSFKPITGKYYYLLKQNGSTNYDVGTINNLASGRKFIFSFWARNSQFKLLNGSQQVTTSSMTTSNGWTLYVANITGSNNPVTLTADGADVPIDEIRLYPIEATMTTSTISPLFGLSSKCDASNNIRYFEYDLQGRPSIVKDIDGNIISVTKTVHQGPNN